MPARLASLLLPACLLSVSLGADGTSGKTPREALQPLGGLIGVWNGTGIPGGNPLAAKDGFWTEKMDWGWKFKGTEAWLTVTFEKSKYWLSGELRWLPGSGTYQLKIKTTDKQELTFEGSLQDRVLNLYREDGSKKETQRLSFQMLHENRILYRFDSRPQGKPQFKRHYQVGANKEGVPFAAGDGRPECIVSGGLGTIAVSHQGKTYYVCCSGCRDEFRADPEKYIREYEAKKKVKK